MVIPSYNISEELEELAEFAALTYRSQVDELIIVEDGGKFSETLREIADIYVYNKTNSGFTKTVNQGWKLSTGDFTAIVNSDTTLIEGKLKDLCIKGKVTSPYGNQNVPHLWGAFFVVPKEIAKERGMLLEEMILYASDSEYDMRVRDIFECVKSVEILHYGAKTVKTAKVDESATQYRDGKEYERLITEGKATPIIND